MVDTNDSRDILGNNYDLVGQLQVRRHNRREASLALSLPFSFIQ